MVAKRPIRNAKTTNGHWVLSDDIESSSCLSKKFVIRRLGKISAIAQAEDTLGVVQWAQSPAPGQRMVSDFREVLQCLETVHQVLGPFGRISASTVGCVPSDGDLYPHLTIDPEIRNDHNDVTGGHSEERFWPADRIVANRPPKPTDDLFALGVVLSEAILSPERVGGIWTATPDPSLFPEKLRENLIPSRLGRFCKWLWSPNSVMPQMALWLLESPRFENRTATDAIKKLDTLVRRRQSIAIAAICLAVVALTSGLWIWVSKTNNALSESERTNTELVAKIQGLEQNSKALVEEIERLRKIIATTPPLPPVDSVPTSEDMGTWKQFSTTGDISKCINAASVYLEDPKKSDPTISHWRSRLIHVRANTQHLETWAANDRELAERLALLVERPWDAIKTDYDSWIVEYVASCNRAYKEWLDWSEGSKSFDELDRAVSRMVDSKEKELLGHWLTEVESAKRLTLAVSRGTSSKPYTKNHLVYARSGPNKSEYRKWLWGSTGSSGSSGVTVMLDYHPGDPLSFWLEQDGVTYNTDVVRVEYFGPLVPWQLSIGQAIKNAETGYSAFMSASPKVGPPYLVGSDVYSDPKPENGAPKSNSGVAKPKYDPLEDASGTNQ